MVTSDHCAPFIGELRHDFDIETLGLSRLQFYSFADYGSVWNINAPLGTAKHDEGASAGGGIRLGWKKLEADFQVAYRLDRPESVTVDNRSASRYCRFQCVSVDRPSPKSSATCTIVRPLVSVNRTASCLKSSVNDLRSRLPIGSSCCVQRYQKVSPFFPGKSNVQITSSHAGTTAIEMNLL